jgi:hypothetical protein
MCLCVPATDKEKERERVSVCERNQARRNAILPQENGWFVEARNSLAYTLFHGERNECLHTCACASSLRRHIFFIFIFWNIWCLMHMCMFAVTRAHIMHQYLPFCNSHNSNVCVCVCVCVHVVLYRIWIVHIIGYQHALLCPRIWWCFTLISNTTMTSPSDVSGIMVGMDGSMCACTSWHAECHAHILVHCLPALWSLLIWFKDGKLWGSTNGDANTSALGEGFEKQTTALAWYSE